MREDYFFFVFFVCDVMTVEIDIFLFFQLIAIDFFLENFHFKAIEVAKINNLKICALDML